MTYFFINLTKADNRIGDQPLRLRKKEEEKRKKKA